MTIKVDVFSGFLGAGKTTLINKLLAETYKNEKLVLIENEFGDVSVDGAFIRAGDRDIEISELSSGCVCCSLSGDFATQMVEIVGWQSPTRILLEPSGVAKLSEVLSILQRVIEQCKLNGDTVVVNGVVTVADARKCRSYLDNFGEFYADQIEHASCILLSRTAGMEETELADCIALLRTYNSKAVIVTTPWEQVTGEQILLAIDGKENLSHELAALQKEADICPICGHHHRHEHHHNGEDCCGHEHKNSHDHKSCCCGHDHHHHHHHGHSAEEAFSSWGMETPRSYTLYQLKNILTTLDQTDTCGKILRAKGAVSVEGDQWLYFDFVPGEINIRIGPPCITGRICVIGSNICETALQQLFTL